MGVPFRIVLFAPDDAVAEKAATAAFARIQALNAIMSDYEAESELSRLSRTSGEGRWVRVSDDLWRVIDKSQELARRSEGAFDITVGPQVNLWRRARRVKQLPDPERLAEANNATGFRKVLLDRPHHAVQLLAKGMKLDLGGIAKGYAVDEAMKVLRTHGIRRALVGGVGDIAVGDPPPGKRTWRISIVKFDAPGAPPESYLSLRNAAVSTSGDAAQKLEINGRRYSHIVDPRTGIGLTDHSLVTVIAKDCTTTDGLATAVSVLGPKCGLELIRRTSGVEVRILREPDASIETLESPGFRRFRSAEDPAEPSRDGIRVGF